MPIEQYHPINVENKHSSQPIQSNNRQYKNRQQFRPSRQKEEEYPSPQHNIQQKQNKIYNSQQVGRRGSQSSTECSNTSVCKN